MKLFLSIILAGLIPLIGLAKEYENTSNRIAVVVNQYLSAEITDSLNTYFQDLKNEGYEPILKEWSLEDNPSPSELKGYLKELYEGGGLQGALFIGDLPVAIFEAEAPTYNIIHYFTNYIGPFPTDHYYMDLESDEWKDTDGNGYLDKPVPTQDNISKRAIWVSRLTVGRESWFKQIGGYLKNGKNAESEMIKNYFIKNHKFRTGEKLYEEKSWNYIPDENIASMLLTSSSYISLNNATDFFIGDLSKSNFLKLLTERSNEIGIWIMHGSTNIIAMSDSIFSSTISSSELASLNIETAFLLPVSCWIGDYTARNYLSGALLFSEKSGVETLIAATIPVRIWPRDLFAYPFQEGRSFGESYLTYLSSKRTLLQEWTKNRLADEVGRVILGDGTLKRQRYLIGSDKIESEEKTLRSADLRKAITPSHIFPLKNTLQFNFSKHLISWDRYYNEDYLTYRLIKIGDDENETTIYEGKDNSVTDNSLKENDKYSLIYVWEEPGTGTFTSQKSKIIARISFEEQKAAKARKREKAAALRNAIESGLEDKVTELVKAGAELNSISEKCDAPINISIKEGSLSMTILLLNLGADPNMQNCIGMSPLQKAIIYDKPDMVALLISHGADVNAISNRGSSGKSILDYAINLNHVKIMELLIEAGAKTEKEMETEKKEL